MVHKKKKKQSDIIGETAEVLRINILSPRPRHLVLLLLVASLGVKGILLLVDREILDTTFVLYLLNCVAAGIPIVCLRPTQSSGDSSPALRFPPKC